VAHGDVPAVYALSEKNAVAIEPDEPRRPARDTPGRR
jgi:hypothetical protein